MQIDLALKIESQLTRLEFLAQEASDDRDESFASRASAMSALSAMLKELTKSQEAVVNMKRILDTEQALIEAAREIFPPDELHVFTDKLKELNSNA